jgi:N-acetylglucosamine kinase-like BadF-type ATPase
VVCLAVRGDGSWHKVDGAGFLFGDAGSAFAIGRAALAAVVRARDGRGPATSLAALSETPERFYTSPDVVRDVAALAPAVLACAAGGDPVARNVLESAAADLAETASAAIAWFGGEHVQLACVGGLFAGGEQVVAPLRRFLPPQADLVPADGTSLDGAERLTASVPSSYQALVSTHRLASSSRGSCARI